MTLVIKERKRFRSFIFACVGIMLGIAVIALAQGATGEMQVKHRVVNVKSGDNLWNIAHDISPNEDTRTTVKKIMSMNSMSSPQVYEHQALLVPVFE